MASDQKLHLWDWKDWGPAFTATSKDVSTNKETSLQLLFMMLDQHVQEVEVYVLGIVNLHLGCLLDTAHARA